MSNSSTVTIIYGTVTSKEYICSCFLHFQWLVYTIMVWYLILFQVIWTAVRWISAGSGSRMLSLYLDSYNGGEFRNWSQIWRNIEVITQEFSDIYMFFVGYFNGIPPSLLRTDLRYILLIVKNKMIFSACCSINIYPKPRWFSDIHRGLNTHQRTVSCIGRGVAEPNARYWPAVPAAWPEISTCFDIHLQTIDDVYNDR